MIKSDLLQLLLASSIHEIKNHFGTLLINIDELVKLNSDHTDNQPIVDKIQSETQTISHRLNEVLGNYKSQTDKFTLLIDQHILSDLFEQVVARHTITQKVHNIELTWECDDDLFGYFDERLIHNIIDTAIFNALQIESEVTKIHLSALEKNDSLLITIEDDGPGFPEQSTNTNEALTVSNISKTGLGLHFATEIAQAHSNNGKTGSIQMTSSKRLGGACLVVQLP